MSDENVTSLGNTFQRKEILIMHKLLREKLVSHRPEPIARSEDFRSLFQKIQRMKDKIGK